eukprot:gene29003-5141_t
MWRFNPADLRAGFAWPCTFLKPTRGGSSGGGGGAAAVIEGSTPKRSGESLSSPTAWGPCGRFGHTATVAPQTDKKGFYIFGGQSEGEHLNDVWYFDVQTETWSELATQMSPPPPQSSASLSRAPPALPATLASGDPPPSPRHCHGAACVGNRILVFGGWSKETPDGAPAGVQRSVFHNDLHSFDMLTE